MVFVKFNRALKRRSMRTDSATDPILLHEIDESSEWLLGRMDGDSSDDDDLVWEDDDLPWTVVSQAMGAEEPNYSTRGAKVTSSSKTDKGKGVASSNQKKSKGPSTSAMTLIDEEDELEEDLDEDDLGYEDVDFDDEDGDDGVSEDDF
ncbi:protein bfr2-like [Raphanus sativus]|uniref:Protein bfr2-like n=1 Tax=Raphanus sativus TaxID=3726 RepID=A0A9W3BXM4_RAPSA|nr:protein bfr2-like [Raphanus sativus]